MQCLFRQEALLFQHLQKCGREILIVGLCVAYFRKHLGQRFFPVLGHKTLVDFQCLLLGIERIDACWSVISIGSDCAGSGFAG